MAGEKLTAGPGPGDGDTARDGVSNGLESRGGEIKISLLALGAKVNDLDLDGALGALNLGTLVARGALISVSVIVTTELLDIQGSDEVGGSGRVAGLGAGIITRGVEGSVSTKGSGGGHDTGGDEGEESGGGSKGLHSV